MAVNQQRINDLLGDVPLTKEEVSGLNFIRRKNVLGGDAYHPSPIFSRERWYSGVNITYKGPKPPTLPEILDNNCYGESEYPGRLDGLIGGGATPRIRLVSIAEYLLSGDMENLDICVPEAEHQRVTRLEGELRRWGAREAGTTANKMQVSVELVNSYCAKYNLQQLFTLMTEALNLNST